MMGSLLHVCTYISEGSLSQLIMQIPYMTRCILSSYVQKSYDGKCVATYCQPMFRGLYKYDGLFLPSPSVMLLELKKKQPTYLKFLVYFEICWSN